jgi:hypothetical protein
MKRLLQFSALFFLVLSLNSCGYTTNTGGSKAFSKKHYNRGIVKQKSNKKESAKETEKLAFDKKAKKHVKMHVEQYVEAKDLTASTDFNKVSSLSDKEIQKNLELIVKESLDANEEVSKKESKKFLKTFNKLFSYSIRHFKKMDEEASLPPASASAAANPDTLNLLAGIFGISAFVLSFIPFLGLLGLPLAISAIVLGAIGLSRGGGKRGWGITGIVLGALALLIWIILISFISAFLLAF